MFHSKTKHIEIVAHFVREQEAAKSLRVQYVPTEHQVFDILTKPLAISRFETLKGNLNIQECVKFSKECEESTKAQPQTLISVSSEDVLLISGEES